MVLLQMPGQTPGLTRQAFDALRAAQSSQSAADVIQVAANAAAQQGQQAAAQQLAQLAGELRTQAGTLATLQQNLAAVQSQQGALQQQQQGLSQGLSVLQQQTGPQGNMVMGPDFNAGVSTSYDGSADPYRGGLIVTDPLSPGLPIAITPNTSVRFGFLADNLARIRQTTACSVYFDIQGPDASLLIQNAGAARITMLINSIPVTNLINVPLAVLLQTLIGTPQTARINQIIQPADNPSFRVDFGSTINLTSPDNQIYAYVDCGRGCRI